MIEMLRQIAKGLNYLHGKNLGHRDIDPRNILVKNGQIKIVDFGYSFQSKIRSKAANTLAGKELYIAPEVLVGGHYCPYKADIFSFGCVMFFLSRGKEDYKISMSSYS